MNATIDAIRCPGCERSFPSAVSLGLHLRFNRGHATEEQSFWAKVKKGEGCWIYLGAKLPSEIGGYGWVSYGGKRMGAHRLAWILTNGPVPKGLEVCHTCDVGPCCRPDHLFLGTHLENMQDCDAKGRRATKLKPQQVAEIRTALLTPYRGINRDLAKKYGISNAQISTIKRGDQWKRV